MSVYLRKRKTRAGLTYYLDIYPGGDSPRWYEDLDLHVVTSEGRSAALNILNQARACRSQREIEMAAGGTLSKPKHIASANFITYFEVRIAKYQGKNARGLKAVLNHFKTFVGRDIVQFSELNKTLVKDFRKHLDGKLQFETPADYFKRFKRVLEDAVGAGFLHSNPAAGVVNKNPVANTLRKNVLFDDEIRELAAAPCGNMEVRRAFLLACMTGLRLCDIRTLKWNMVNLSVKELKIVQNKTAVPLIVKLNASAVTLLGMPKKPAEYIFNLKQSTNAINDVIETWVSKTKIKKAITFGCSRHSFITNIYFHTTDQKLAGSLAGHTSLKHTDKYTHLVDKKRQEAVDKLPGILFDGHG